MTTGNEYGKALFMLAEESMQTESALNEIRAVSKIFADNPDYIKLLDTPAVTVTEKIRLVDEAFYCFSDNIKNLIKILCERRLVFTVFEIEKTFLSLYDSLMGIERAEAVSAIAMSEEQIKRLEDKLSGITGKKIILKNTVDKSILGGVKIRYLGKQLDGSIKARLRAFEESLRAKVL